MAKSDVDTAIAAGNTQGRSTAGRMGTKFSSPSAAPKSGTLVPKKDSKSVDPSASGVGVRQNVPYSGERVGAAYSVKVRYTKATAPEAGLTQANGRLVNPAVTRQEDSWKEGIATSY